MRLTGLFIAAILGPPFVSGVGDFMQNHGAHRAGRIVSAVLPSVVRAYSVWEAFDASNQLQRRLNDIEARIPPRSAAPGAAGLLPQQRDSRRE
jgi:hypothetical protein